MIQDIEGNTCLHSCLNELKVCCSVSRSCTDPNILLQVIKHMYEVVSCFEVIIRFDHQEIYPDDSSLLLHLRNNKNETVLSSCKSLTIQQTQISKALSLHSLCNKEYKVERGFHDFMQKCFCLDIIFMNKGMKLMQSSRPAHIKFYSYLVNIMKCYHTIRVKQKKMMEEENVCFVPTEMNHFNKLSNRHQEVIMDIFAKPVENTFLIDSSFVTIFVINDSNKLPGNSLSLDIENLSNQKANLQKTFLLKKTYEILSKELLWGTCFYYKGMNMISCMKKTTNNDDESQKASYSERQFNKIRKTWFEIAGIKLSKLTRESGITSPILFRKNVINRVDLNDNDLVNQKKEEEMKKKIDRETAYLRRSTIYIQAAFRGNLERSRMKQKTIHKKQEKSALFIQRCFRIKKQKENERLQASKIFIAQNLQNVFRQKEAKKTLTTLRAELLHKKRAVQKFTCIMLGHRVRMKVRLHVAKTFLGETFLFNEFKLNNNKNLDFVRSVKHWEQYKVKRCVKVKHLLVHPLFCYMNTIRQKYTWIKPEAILKLDEQSYRDMISIYKDGFSKSQVKIALLLQRTFRRRKSRYWLNIFFKSLTIMITSERKYFEGLNNLVIEQNKSIVTFVPVKQKYLMQTSDFSSLIKPKSNATERIAEIQQSTLTLMNYTLHQLLIAVNINKSTQLLRILESKVEAKGIQNSFYNLIRFFYVAQTEEATTETFKTLAKLVSLAKQLKFLNYNLVHVELGFLLSSNLDILDTLVVLTDEKKAIQAFNYAIFIQFFGSCTKFGISWNYFLANDHVSVKSRSLRNDYVYEVSDNMLNIDDLELSEKYFLKAMSLDPYNEKILNHFNFMLKYLRKDSEGAEAKFRRLSQSQI